MTRNLLALCAAGILVSLGSLAAAETPTLTVELSAREIRVGDLIEATLVIDLDSGARAPSFPNWQHHWGSAEIRDIGKVSRRVIGDGGPGSAGSAGSAGSDSSEPRARHTQTLVLTSFRPGIVTLPPATVTLHDEETGVEISSEPATFEVGSVLPVGEEQLEPKPPAPPRSLPLGDRFWWTAGLLALFAAGLLALILTRRRAGSTYPGEAIDPWDAFDLALARLATQADPETVFTGLSLELRRYLGSCLAFPAAESTTTELRRRLLRSGLPSGVCGDIVGLLVEADAVKFAKKAPTPDRVSECLDQTRAAADDVRSFLEREESTEGEEVAA